MILEVGGDAISTLEAPWSGLSRIHPVAPNRFVEYGYGSYGDMDWTIVGIASWPQKHIDVRDVSDHSLAI